MNGAYVIRGNMKNKGFIFLIAALFSCLSVCAQHEIKVSSFKELLSDLSASTNRRYDLNDDACALVKVQYPMPNATFEGNIIGDVEFRNNEYWVYVSKGTKRIKIHLPSAPTIQLEFVDFDIPQAESNVTYIVEFKFPEKTSNQTKKIETRFYVDAGYFIGGAGGMELSVGTYIGGFNIELNYMVPIGGKQDLYWNHASLPSLNATYKPTMALGGRLGYGIKAGEKFRITPQMGVKFLKTSEAIEGSSDEHASGAYCNSFLLACRLQYRVNKHFGLSLTPEYDIRMMKSEGFKALSEASSGINKWNNGIGIRIAANLEF